MQTITSASRETRLYMHTLSAALCLAVTHPAIVLDTADIHEPSPAAQSAAVAARLDSTMGELERLIRAKKAPPLIESPATSGRKLIERGEVYDAVAHTYTPGPGFETLLNAITGDVLAELQ